MNPPLIVDIVFIVLLFLLMIRSTLRGFVTEFLSLAAVACGLAAAIMLYRAGATFLRERYLDMKYLPEIIAFVVLFFIPFAFVKIIQYVLTDIVDRINLHAVDRFLGFVLGFAEGIVVISLILVLFTVQPVFDVEPLLKGSFFSELFLPVIRGESPAGVNHV
jgi:membrane protein required for colicin V production